MSSKISIDILDVTEDALSVLEDVVSDNNICDILSIAEDVVPGLRFILKTYNTISDRVLIRKFEKFIAYANKSKTTYSFEKFKKKINSNEKYRNKVSEYMLFKINKFDVDYKLKIFSHACIDFFNSNITENTLIEISEVIDNLNTADIEIIKCLSQYNSDLIQIKMVVDELLDKIDDFKIYSSILKLTNYSIVLEDSQSTWGALKDKHLKQICLSPFGKTLHKYL